MIPIKENADFEIVDILRLSRIKKKYHTDKRGVAVFSIRLNGTGVFTYRDKEHICNENKILYIPKNVEYSQRTDGEEIIAVHLLYDNFSITEISTETFENNAAVKEAFIKIYSVWQAKQAGYKLKTKSIMYAILYEIMNNNKKTYESNDWLIIQNAVNYIRENFTSSGAIIDEAASKSFISTVYFRRLFKKEFGITPLEYINELRIEYAKSLIAGGHGFIGETAYASGFSSYKYFAYVFKKKTGCTPGEYKKRM